MSITSAMFRPAPGLENATTGQKVDCIKDKLKVVGTYGLASGAIASSSILFAGAALNNDKFASSVSKVVDKAANSNIGKTAISKAKGLGKAVVDFAKNNPKAAKAIALIGTVGVIGSTIFGAICDRKLAKIEGQHQEKVDCANKH